MAWTNTMSLKPKQSCIDCHFFVEGDRENTVLIKASERESLRQGNNPWATRDLALSCSFGVWDEGLAPFDFLVDDRQQTIVEKDRGDSCFWWPYNPAMLLPAAKILQEREAKNREAEHDRILTRKALWIAAIALVANVALKAYELFFSGGRNHAS
jgi:hypothetical protein